MGRWVCVTPAEDAPGRSAAALGLAAAPCRGQCCTALTAPFSCQRHPCDVLAPRRQLTPGRGGGHPPGQPKRCSPVPLPSAAEGAALRAAGGGTSPPAEGWPPARPAPPVPFPSVPPARRAGGACGGRREFPGSGHIGSIQPQPPAAGSDSSAPAAGAAPVPVMAATDLERFSVSTAPLSYAPFLDHTTWGVFVTRRRGNNPVGGGDRTPGGDARPLPH